MVTVVDGTQLHGLRKHTPVLATVPTFNSCTKYVGSEVIIHDRMHDYHPLSGHGCMDVLTPDRTLICKLRGLLMCLA